MPVSGEELRVLAEEQAALRRVATLVARGVPPDEVFAAVTTLACCLPYLASSRRHRHSPIVLFLAGIARAGPRDLTQPMRVLGAYAAADVPVPEGSMPGE